MYEFVMTKKIIIRNHKYYKTFTSTYYKKFYGYV